MGENHANHANLSLLDDLNQIKNKFHLNYEKKFIENKEKIFAIKTEINNKTKEIIKKLICNQEKILQATEKIEKSITKQFHSLLLNEQQIEANLDEYTNSLNSDRLDQNELKKLNEKLKKTKAQFMQKLEVVEELSFDYELKQSEYLALNNEINLLGEIMDKSEKALANLDQIVSCSDDMTVKLWDLQVKLIYLSYF